MCYDCDKRDIVKNAKDLGIEVRASLGESDTVWFNSEQDMNLYKVIGSVKEGHGIRFLVAKKTARSIFPIRNIIKKVRK